MSIKNLMSLSGYVNWIWVVITLLVFSILIKLGLWQSDRAIEKEERLEKISTLKGAKALSLEALLKSSVLNIDELNDLPVILNGAFESDVLILHDNQPNKGRFGYRVFQVFNVKQHAVLVNLGWVLGSRDRNILPTIDAISGQMTLQGHVRFIDVGVMLAEQHFDNAQWPLRVQQIEIEKISRLINKQLLPFAVFLDKKEQVGYEKNWQPVVMPPEKHWGYAFQWFSLALAWLILMIWAAVKSKRSAIKINTQNNN